MERANQKVDTVWKPVDRLRDIVFLFVITMYSVYFICAGAVLTPPFILWFNVIDWLSIAAIRAHYGRPKLFTCNLLVHHTLVSIAACIVPGRDSLLSGFWLLHEASAYCEVWKRLLKWALDQRNLRTATTICDWGYNATWAIRLVVVWPYVLYAYKDNSRILVLLLTSICFYQWYVACLKWGKTFRHQINAFGAINHCTFR